MAVSCLSPVNTQIFILAFVKFFIVSGTPSCGEKNFVVKRRQKLTDASVNRKCFKIKFNLKLNEKVKTRLNLNENDSKVDCV